MKINWRIAAAAIVLCAGAAMAKPPEGGDWKKNGMSQEARDARFEKMQAELGLTPEQAEKLKAIRKASMEKGMALFQAMKTKREALRAELEKEKIDESRVNALNNELKDLRNQMDDQRLASVLEVRKILTPEQFAKFQAYREENREKFREHFQEHREGKTHGAKKTTK